MGNEIIEAKSEELIRELQKRGYSIRPKTKVFIDMDGTVAEWRKAASIEELKQKGYWESLKPQMWVIAEAFSLVLDAGFEVYVESAVLDDNAIREKNIWLDTHMPFIEESRRIFVPDGSNKADAVKARFGMITQDFVLLDDYNKNLWEWKASGGRAVKVLNGINSPWDGEQIYMEMPHKLAHMLRGNVTLF